MKKRNELTVRTCASCDAPKMSGFIFCAKHLKEEYDRHEKQSKANGWGEEVKP